ncbi:MAG: carbon-monoxide dehydrogenase [Xanthobacteraceae bacterium]|nr:carbon-monoxide dehydrogenase [Xanthobacteraceae bacterium]
MKVTPAVNTFVGRPVERVEDLRYLRGKGQYLDDLQKEGQWCGAVLRSSVAHGRLVNIDTKAALDIPGVHAVITAADLPSVIPTIPFRRPNPTIAPYAQPVIAVDKVRYVGEPIAFVLADSAEIAEDALQFISVEIDTLDPIVDWRASENGATLLFDSTQTNIASVFEARSGDAAEAFRAAPYVRRERFSVQRHTAMPMETRGLLAEWDEATSHLTVWGAAKLPFFNRRAMAGMMGLQETAVDYLELDVGGGFGARGEFYPEDFLVAFSAKHFKRPVKWVEDRREHFLAIAHAREMEAELEIACDLDGSILGMRGTINVDIGAYVRPNGMTPVRNVTQFIAGPYRIANLAFDGRALVSNKTPAGTYRGPGRFEGCFFCERMIDLAAKDLNLDGVDMRRRNLLTQADMPYALATVSPNDGFAETACDSGDYRTTFDQCLNEFGWQEKSPLNGQCIDGLYHGIAIGNFIEGGAAGPRESAKIELERDGSVSVYVGSSGVGQGVETIMSQIAADALEISLDRIRLFHGSTSNLKEGFGSYGSRGTVMGGSAVLVAAKEFLAAFQDAAAERLRVPSDQVTVEGGVARTRDGRSVPLIEIAALELISREATYHGSKQTYTFGAAAVHVSVDPKTGRVNILDYVTVDDVGRVINPLTLHGQVVGAAVQGFGGVFSEHLQYDSSGQLLVGSLADYMIPISTDYPHIRAISLEQYPSPNNPLGAKGAGEGGIIPVGGVVVNAIASALRSFGVEPRSLPLTPPHIWQLIQETKS